MPGWDCAAIPDRSVRTVFEACDEPARACLLDLRRLILETAMVTEGVGAITETLKWGQLAYLPTTPRIGTTIRIDHDRASPDMCSLFVHCQSGLIDSFRQYYPTIFTYCEKRSLSFSINEPMPKNELRHCIALALTHHLRKRKKAVA